MIEFKQTGDFKKTEKFLSLMKKIQYRNILNRYGKIGVQMLAAATPIDTGDTANSWSYDIEIKNGQLSIFWKNSNIQDGVPIAVILQYGHGTKNGGYVVGRDYINPAMQPIFDDISNEAWKGITRL